MFPLGTLIVGGGIIYTSVKVLLGVKIYQKARRGDRIPWFDDWVAKRYVAVHAKEGASPTDEIKIRHEFRGPDPTPAAKGAGHSRHLAILGLTSATGLLHIGLGTPLLILNGVGYFGLLALHYLPEQVKIPALAPYRRYTREALIGYTGTTFVAYFFVRGLGGFVDPTGIVTKLVEAGLLGLLWQEQTEERQQHRLAEEWVIIEVPQGMEGREQLIDVASTPVTLAPTTAAA